MTDAFALREQADWEVAAVNRAVARYQEAKRRMEVHELPPGSRALAETVGPVSATIAKKHVEWGAPLGRGPAPLSRFAFITSTPEVMAVVGIVAALRSSFTPGGRRGVSIPEYARRVASILRDQHDHDQWVAEQEAAQRAAVKSAKTAGVPLADVREDAALRRFRKQFPEGDRKAWAKFANKMELARGARWNTETAVQVAATLAECLAEGAPEWFEVCRSGVGHVHLWPLCLCLTEKAVERLADMDVRAEVARPMLLPMIMPPIPWAYVDKEETE